jgi:hypothetical protein
MATAWTDNVERSLAQTLPATGHVAPVPAGGLIQH